jgi:hypothetical protein
MDERIWRYCSCHGDKLHSKVQVRLSSGAVEDGVAQAWLTKLAWKVTAEAPSEVACDDSQSLSGFIDHLSISSQPPNTATSTDVIL